MPVLRLLAIVLACLWAGQGRAVEMQRNGVTYDLSIALPSGAKLGRVGNDRKFTLGGVEATFRLVQDSYGTCLKLVEERKAARKRDGFKEVNREIAEKECSIGMMDGERRVSSFYTWVERCQCYAAVHFAYASENRAKFLSIYKPVLASLKDNKAVEPTEPPPAAAVEADTPTPPVVEAATAPPPQANPNSLKMTFRNGDTTDMAINFRTRERTHAWPTAATSWSIAAGQSRTMAIACKQGVSICFGAGRVKPDKAYWGRGVQGRYACENCCYLCGGGDVAVNLLPGTIPGSQPSRDAIAASDVGIGPAAAAGLSAVAAPAQVAPAQ